VSTIPLIASPKPADAGDPGAIASLGGPSASAASRRDHEIGLAYVVGVREHTTVWRPGEAPLPPKAAKRFSCAPGAREEAFMPAATLKKTELRMVNNGGHVLSETMVALPRRTKNQGLNV
jgi:hypothetical protein